MFLSSIVVYLIADTFNNKTNLFESYEIQSDLPSFIFGKPFWNDDYIFNEKKNPDYRLIRGLNKLENLKREIDELEKEEKDLEKKPISDEDRKSYLRSREEQKELLNDLKKTFHKNLRKYKLHPDDINYD